MQRSYSARAHSYALAVIAIVFSIAVIASVRTGALAYGNGDRLELDDIRYVGSFRVPGGEFGSREGFSFGGAPLAYNPTNHSLFLGGFVFEGQIAEISIPTPVGKENVSELPTADVLQGFADPTEGGREAQNFGNGATLDGLLVYGGRLYGTVRTYYDGGYQQRVSHYSRSLTLDTKSATPLVSVWDPAQTGFVAGWLATVPSAWRTALRGPLITGQCCTTIISGTSWGPAAFSWNPEELDNGKSLAEATPLVYYNGEHPTLGSWGGSNEIYGGTTQVAGLALVGGTRTALFAGYNGMGRFCYGNGTDDPDLDGTIGEDGLEFCYDPSNHNKGQHAYPYRTQFWAYDLNEWAAVAAGTRQPWNVTPYAVWPFDVPTGGGVIGGVAFDEQRQRLYLSQIGGEEDGYSYRPLIHVFAITDDDEAETRPPRKSPANVAVAVTPGSIVVSWGPVNAVVAQPLASAALSYRLDFSATPTGPALATVPASGTSIRVPLPPGVAGTFYVRVTGMNRAGAGPTSAPIAFTVGRGRGGSCPGVPSTPTSLTGNIVGGTATVRWNASAGAASYIVQAGLAEGSSSVFNQNVGGITMVSARGLAPGFRAFVRIIAVNACGQSAPTADLLLQ